MKVPRFGDPLGRIVVDGVVWPIVQLKLERGSVHAIGVLNGPHDGHPQGRMDVTVYAPDGSVVVSTVMEFPGWEAMPEGTWTYLDLPWHTEFAEEGNPAELKPYRGRWGWGRS